MTSISKPGGAGHLLPTPPPATPTCMCSFTCDMYGMPSSTAGSVGVSSNSLANALTKSLSPGDPSNEIGRVWLVCLGVGERDLSLGSGNNDPVRRTGGSDPERHPPADIDCRLASTLSGSAPGSGWLPSIRIDCVPRIDLPDPPAAPIKAVFPNSEDTGLGGCSAAPAVGGKGGTMAWLGPRN